MRNEQPERRGDDEIDLFELLGGLWKQKLLIILTAAIVSGGAVAYALLATPIYEAKVLVQPPSQSNISQLNYGRGGDSGLAMLSVKDVYDVYLRNLRSESLKREFFRKVYLLSLPEDERKRSQDDLYDRMNSVLTVAVTSKDTPSRYYVMANLPVAEEAAQWVVQYAQMAGEHAKREVIKDVRGDVMIKASNLGQQIAAARETARKQREDQIIQLTEALRIADSIGLVKPPIISNSLSNEVSAGMDGSLTYMRGSKALRAEIDNLRSRTSDDPFIVKLRQREEAMAFYSSLQIDPGVIEVYRQDGAVELPDKPVKPKKLIIVSLGAVLGVVFGIFIALMKHLWNVKARRNPS
ncbi:MAG: Wzz/FepE/Etk N-terminal domain-containing protein [Hafnia sp.]